MNARRTIAVIAAACLLPAAPTYACSVRWQPFGDAVRSLSRDGWAVRADATVRFERYDEMALAGTLHLSNIRCHRRPRGADCPTSLDISFSDEHGDGANCASTMRRGLSDAPYPRLRYFLLSGPYGGRWIVGMAYQSYWGD